VPVLLGTDVPELDQLLGIVNSPEPEQCLMVVTRAQALKQAENSTVRESEQQCGGSHILRRRNNPLLAVSLMMNCFERLPEACRVPTISENSTAGSHTPLGISGDDLRRLQWEDATLTKGYESVTNFDYPPGGSHYWRDGLLCRQWKPSKRAPELVIEQIVLPEQCRTKVLELAQSIPLSGHLGKDKTRERISHLVWSRCR